LWDCVKQIGDCLFNIIKLLLQNRYESEESQKRLAGWKRQQKAEKNALSGHFPVFEMYTNYMGSLQIYYAWTFS
jgi:hypothetical protein